jgi:glyoxylase-like metal-dependent hydrolase (beta-lactamase superfamily II)
MEVERFSTGRVRPKAAAHGVRRYLPGGWSDEKLPVNVFLVRHPQGLCLFDTGQTARAAEPGYHPSWHPFLRLARFELEPGDEIGAQLTGRGIAPADVRWVVLSHLHTDHVGGVGAFPDAEVIVSRVEWERAQGRPGRLRGYVPQHWPLGEPVIVDLSGPPVGPFTGSFDVAGDGRLLLVPTPGHTPGHVSLIVRDESSPGGFFLGGDIAHAPADLPPRIAEFCAAERLTVLLAHDPDA